MATRTSTLTARFIFLRLLVRFGKRTHCVNYISTKHVIQMRTPKAIPKCLQGSGTPRHLDSAVPQACPQKQNALKPTNKPCRAASPGSRAWTAPGSPAATAPSARGASYPGWSIPRRGSRRPPRGGRRARRRSGQWTRSTRPGQEGWKGEQNGAG